jgi:tRNA(fMet)-specific endonuclease VapC
MKYLIDTDIASYYLRGKYDLNKIFEEKQITLSTLSIITVAELEVLAHKNPHSKINLSTISHLAHLLGILNLDQDTWHIFSATKAKTLSIGKPKGDFDLLQASIAKQNNLILVTHNLEHYKDIIDCEDWTTGYSALGQS